MAYQPYTDGQTETTNQLRQGYLHKFVNSDQNHCYQLRPIAQYSYNKSKVGAHKLTTILAQNCCNLQMERMKETEAQNPGATIYTHWINTVQEKARVTREKTREARKEYYNQRATPEPEIGIGDMVMLKREKHRNEMPDEDTAPTTIWPL